MRLLEVPTLVALEGGENRGLCALASVVTGASRRDGHRSPRPTMAALRGVCAVAGKGADDFANGPECHARIDDEDEVRWVELRGFEPLTPCLPSKCSTS